jgi:hypothetical protein
MMKRFLPLVLMLAWAPAALAYPPCKPSNSPSPLVIWDLSGSPPDIDPWFQTGYALYGDSTVVNVLRAGKCKDRMPVQASNVSNSMMGLNPGLSPVHGFGALALPELPMIASGDLNLRYRLDLNIDNAPLLNVGDWVDVAQLDFAYDRGLTSAGWPVSRVYRVRKIHRDMVSYVQVIEVRSALGSGSTEKPIPIVAVVAEIPLTGADGKTAIALRWTQSVQTPGDGIQEDLRLNDVDSTIEVLWLGQESVGPANAVLYSATLPRQWADSLLTGLLDYNIPVGSAYGSHFHVETSDLYLDAETF